MDDSAIDRPEDWEAGDNLEAVETVEHRINADFQGKTIPLTFYSEADLLYCSEEFKAHITAATAADLVAEQGDLAFLSTSEALIGWLTEQTGDPVAQPEGEDEPLCSIRYRLVGIGGIEVAGLVLVNGYNEITLEELNDDYQHRPDEQVFCWLHALDSSRVEQLGITTAPATPDTPESDTPPPYPSWVSQDVGVEGCWLTADELQQSYASGRRLRNGGRPIRLELGCGLDWDLRHDSEQFPDEELAKGGGDIPGWPSAADQHFAGSRGWDRGRRTQTTGPYLVNLAEAASTGKGG